MSILKIEFRSYIKKRKKCKSSLANLKMKIRGLDNNTMREQQRIKDWNSNILILLIS